MIFTSVPTIKIKQNSENQHIIGRFTVKGNTDKRHLMQLVNNNYFYHIFEFIKWQGLAKIRWVLGNNYYRIREFLLKNLK